MEGLVLAGNGATLDQIIQVALSGQAAGKAGFLVQAQLFSQGGPAHIAVQQDDPLAQLCQGVSQIDGGQALALAHQGAGHADHAAAVVLRKGELQLGTQQLVGLGSSKADPIAVEGCRPILAAILAVLVLPSAPAVAVGAALAGSRHIRHSGQDGMLTVLGNILFGADGDIHQFQHHDNRRHDHQTQGKAQQGVLGIAGRAGAGGQHCGIHHLGGSAVNDAGDPLGQDVGNGIGNSLRLFRIFAGDHHPENFRFIHRFGRDHALHFAISTVNAGIVDHIVQRFPGLQNHDIGIDQILGRGKVRCADDAVDTHIQSVVIDIEHGGRLILGCHEQHRVGQRQHRAEHRHGTDQPRLFQQRAEQPRQVDLDLFIFHIFVVHLGPPWNPDIEK